MQTNARRKFLKPHALSFAVMAALLPLASSVQAESVMDGAQFFVSQRLWQADWEVGVNNPQVIAPAAGQPTPLLRTKTDFVKVSRTMPLTGFGVSVDRWTLSATVGWPTDYENARFEGTATRSEYDINLGYAVTPNLSVVALYKAGKADIPAASGNPAATPLRERQKLHGAGLGVSGRYPIAENWNLYGSTAYSGGKTSFQVSGGRYSLRYTIAEAGVGYRIPGAFSNMSVTAGYRYQNLSFRHTHTDTFALTPEPVLVSSEPERIRTSTKGFTVGVTVAF
jgi:hypothetical protein